MARVDIPWASAKASEEKKSSPNLLHQDLTEKVFAGFSG